MSLECGMEFLNIHSLCSATGDQKKEAQTENGDFV